MADFTEWEIALRTAMLADVTFAGLLGDAQQFYEAGQAENPVYPIAIWKTTRLGRVQLDRGGRKYRPDISISFFATNPQIARNLAEYAGNKFRIPDAGFSLQLTTTNWRVDEFICADVMDGGPSRVMNDGTVIHEFVTDWRALVYQRT